MVESHGQPWRPWTRAYGRQGWPPWESEGPRNGTRHSGPSESTPPQPIRVQRHPQTMPAEPVGAVAQGHGQPGKGETDATGRVTVIIDTSTLMSANATEPQFHIFRQATDVVSLAGCTPLQIMSS